MSACDLCCSVCLHFRVFVDQGIGCLLASGMQVYAYSVAFGRQLGSWAAHDDTVACLQLLTGEQVVTASWDCSVKLWRRALHRHALHCAQVRKALPKDLPDVIQMTFIRPLTTAQRCVKVS